MAIVYLHRRMDTNEVFYVGIGVDKKRSNNKTRRNKYWKNIVNKHGYTVEILHENISHDECREIEIDLIRKYGRKDLGTGSLCNLTDGGEGVLGLIVSDETKRKLSEINKGKTHSDETKRKLSEINKGKKVSDETRRKLSEMNKGEKHPFFGKTGEGNPFFGKKHSEETLKKMSESAKGRKHSEETLKKISEAAKGRKHSDETRRKMRETRRKNKENLDN